MATQPNGNTDNSPPITILATTPLPPSDSLGGRLLVARAKKGLSRASLADLSGVSAATIVRSELKGHVPSVANLLALAGVLEVSITELLDEKPPVAS